jgi:ketosteroid isomerase-like protein
MAANDVGDVVVEVDVEGTQERPWGLVASAGRHYAEPHLFVLHVTKDDLIDRITAYWNDASVHRQLGHEEVD